MATDWHGGNLKKLAAASGWPMEEILDFSANINPLGLPDWLRPLISSKISSIVHYPDPDCTSLVEAFSTRYGVAPEEVLVGNGSSEILYLLPRVLKATGALIPVPAYGDYTIAAEAAGLPVKKMFLREEDGFLLDLRALETRLAGREIVILGQPNNPTGLLFDPEALRQMAGRYPSATFIVDEAFADFIQGMDSLSRNRPPNVIVLCSLTKFFAIPGLRLGCAIMNADTVSRMRRVIPPWSVNAFAQTVGEVALRDERYAEKTREFVRQQRESLLGDLRSFPGLTVYPGQANFLLVRVNRKNINAAALAQRLLDKGIAIRVCDNFDGLDSRFFRVAVRTAEENGKLCSELRAVFNLPQRSGQKRRPAIMFQGTTSNAGKSVLAAALCRILLQDGYRVAPFKAQNMSLNSFVTCDGGEMGRAQVVQAQASRLDPDVRMNPVLLKPTGETGAQVILLGKPVGNMDVVQYIQYKPEAFKAVRQAYDSLAREFDVMVLEGAGSPAEVNLKHHDIVNMAMAHYAGSPVLLVGDIDRGGVFASFVGTMEVLAEWERALVAGFVINRFRGEKSLLREGIDYAQRHTGIPTLGVVPYLGDLGLPEEDSVTFKGYPREGIQATGERVEIALIDLPHISNFTDFDALRIEPDVHLRIVRQAQDLQNPDAVILPGSKNVIGDLDYLQENGLAQKILHLGRAGHTEVIGICGGLQILGEEVADPYGIESSSRSLQGLGMLAVSTVLAKEKTLQRVEARHLDSGHRVKGYEIHHGQTKGNHLLPILIREDGEMIGFRSVDGRCWGTYLHGIFDADDFRRWFIDHLRERRGLPPLGQIQAAYDLEPAFDRLADVVRQSLQINEIYRMMGLP
jgi:cobyric acid synthase CobQ/L-threonine-O-3-phosphate decarboxylase